MSKQEHFIVTWKHPWVVESVHQLGTYGEIEDEKMYFKKDRENTRWNCD